MAGDWIKLERETLDKPEVLLIARRLKCSRGDALFCCLKLWAWADANLTDGRTMLEEEQLDEIMGRPGAAAALLDPAVRWLGRDHEGGIYIPRFDDHHGQSAKRRARKQKQKKGERRTATGEALGAADAAMYEAPPSGPVKPPEATIEHSSTVRPKPGGDGGGPKVATERRQMSPSGDDKMATREEKNKLKKQTRARGGLSPAGAAPGGGGAPPGDGPGDGRAGGAHGGGGGGSADPQQLDIEAAIGLAKGSVALSPQQRREAELADTIRKQRQRLRSEGMRIGALVPA